MKQINCIYTPEPHITTDFTRKRDVIIDEIIAGIRPRDPVRMRRTIDALIHHCLMSIFFQNDDEVELQPGEVFFNNEPGRDAVFVIDQSRTRPLNDERVYVSHVLGVPTLNPAARSSFKPARTHVRSLARKLLRMLDKTPRKQVTTEERQLGQELAHAYLNLQTADGWNEVEHNHRHGLATAVGMILDGDLSIGLHFPLAPWMPLAMHNGIYPKQAMH